MADLEATLEEENKASQQMDLSLETSSFPILFAETEFEEEKQAHQSRVKIFQDKLADLDKQLLYLSAEGLEGVAFKNDMDQLELYNLYLYFTL